MIISTRIKPPKTHDTIITINAGPSKAFAIPPSSKVVVWVEEISSTTASVVGGVRKQPEEGKIKSTKHLSLISKN